jgi:hypothetical protein
MAPQVRKMVTSPYHGPDGHEVILNPGDHFPLDAELPDGALTTVTVVDMPDDEPVPAEPAPAPPPPVPPPPVADPPAPAPATGAAGKARAGR